MALATAVLAPSAEAPRADRATFRDEIFSLDKLRGVCSRAVCLASSLGASGLVHLDAPTEERQSLTLTSPLELGGFT